MTNKLKNTQTVEEIIRTSLNLVKSTTTNSEDFKEAYRNLMVIIRSEYDKIKDTPYDLVQSDLVKQQYELVKLLAEQADVKLTNTTKKKSTQKKSEDVVYYSEMKINDDGTIHAKVDEDKTTVANGVLELVDSVSELDSAVKNLQKVAELDYEVGVDLAKGKDDTVIVNEKWEEIIIVAPRKELFEDESLTKQGVIEKEEIVNKIIENMSDYYTTMRRGSTEDSTPKENNAEINTDYKQPIPYGVLKRGDEIYVYERLSGGGESRLHSKLSIGLGGHCNPVEGSESFDEELKINFERELEEELNVVASNYYTDYIGLINDDEDEVGRVHLGILFVRELGNDSTVEVKETEQLKGEWMTLEQLSSPEVYERLEGWSKMVVDVLNK